MLCCWVAITLRVFLRLGKKVEQSMKHSTSAFLVSRSRTRVLPLMRTLHLPPAVFAAKKQLSQKPTGISDGVRRLRAEPAEAENGQNALVPCPGVSGTPRGVG